MNRPGASRSPVRDLPDHLARAIEAAHVPPLPQALLHLLRIVDDDGSSTRQIARAVELDAALSARVLTAANSPALRRGRELRSIENCLAALGTRLVRSLATCLAVHNVFDRHRGKSPVDLTGFWLHSLRVAELARRLATAAGHPQPDEAYLAGLLHDVGELVMLSALGDDYAPIVAASLDEGQLSALEAAKLGVEHAEVGAWVVDQWQTDTAVADAILFHHASAEAIASAGALPQIVWLAHGLSAGGSSVAELAPLAQQWQGLAAEALHAACSDADASTRQLAGALGITLPETGTTSVLPIIAGMAPPVPAAAPGPHDELDALVHGMALLQPLQRDLFGIESDVELLLSLRESARILFELSRTAFLFCETGGQHLSGTGFGDQPTAFRHARIRVDDARSLPAAAARAQQCRATFDDEAPAAGALLDLQFARAFGTDGLLCVPMIGRRRTVGVMVFGISAAQHTRLRRRMPWLLNFGRIAAASLEAWQDARDYRQRAEGEASQRYQRQARRVIHEAGNPLGIIKSYLRILDGKLPEGTELRQELDVLREEIDRVASIVSRMSELPPAPHDPAGFDAAALARELLALYGAALFGEKRIAVATAITGHPATVICDRDGLKQILINLLKNASEAMAAGGHLALEVSADVIQNGRSFVEIRLEDDGPGLPPGAMRALLEPAAVRTEGDRGMGLSIVGEVAARLGILLTCRNRPERGSSIALLIPSNASGGKK